MQRTIKSLLICAGLALSAVSFVNCSAGVGVATNGYASNSAQGYNGGGHSGKLDYVYYSDAPICTPSAGAGGDGDGTTGPDKRIEIASNSIRLFENQCTGTSESNLTPRDLFANPYDPLYLVHNDLIYINKEVLAVSQAGDKVVARAFCFNPNYRNPSRGQEGFDVGVRHYITYVNGVRSVSTSADIIYGKGALAPEVSNVPGTLRDPPAGTQDGPFIAADGSYRVDFSARTAPVRGTAVATLASGEKINLDCFYEKPIIPDSK